MNETLARNYRAALGRLSPVFTKAQNIPLGVLDNAYFSVQSGGASIQQAIKTAVNTLAEDGIRAAIYPSGRSMAIPEFTRMIVRTSVLQNTAELNFQRAQEYGSDLILISSHAGARPRCFPFQGRVYSMSGQHQKYPPFSSTSYGEPAGIFGINCGHYPTPFIEGLSREPDAEDRDPAKAAGKDNDAEYIKSQMQRYNERKIREWKRRVEALEEAGIDNTRARAKVREWQAEQRRFIGVFGRTRRYDRERVFSSGSGGGVLNLKAKGSIIDLNSFPKTLHEAEMSIRSLNYETGVIASRSGQVLYAVKGDKNSVALPVDLIKDNIVTHNHPRGICAFSIADIRAITVRDGYEMRAVTGDARFVSLAQGTGTLNKSIADEMKKDGLGGMALTASAKAQALKKYGLKATTQQIEKEMEDIVNAWFQANAAKFGYIFTRGNI